MLQERELHGVFIPLVTPFQADGSLDLQACHRYVGTIAQTSLSGIVINGTTGESPTLTHDEHRQVVKSCVAAAKGRVPVVAGAGSNNTVEAVGLAKELRRRGFSFVGPTSMHALMEAIGIVDTHLVDSHRRGSSGVWSAGDDA